MNNNINNDIIDTSNKQELIENQLSNNYNINNKITDNTSYVDNKANNFINTDTTQLKKNYRKTLQDDFIVLAVLSILAFILFFNIQRSSLQCYIYFIFSIIFTLFLFIYKKSNTRGIGSFGIFTGIITILTIFFNSIFGIIFSILGFFLIVHSIKYLKYYEFESIIYTPKFNNLSTINFVITLFLMLLNFFILFFGIFLQSINLKINIALSIISFLLSLYCFFTSIYLIKKRQNCFKVTFTLIMSIIHNFILFNLLFFSIKYYKLISYEYELQRHDIGRNKEEIINEIASETINIDLPSIY